MNEPKAEPGRLVFRHTRLVLGSLGLLVALIVGLAWLDDARGKRELERLRVRLCGELPAELVQGLSTLSRDARRAPDAARQALSILEGLPGDAHERRTQARILYESTSGWRELRSWSDEPGWAHEPALVASVRRWRCDAVIEQGQLRVARPLKTASGLVVLLVIEQQRE